MWDWYARPGDWRTRGGRRTGLIIALGLAAIVGAGLFAAAILLASRLPL